MVIVFPVADRDFDLALPVAKWMRKLGPYPRHDALLVWSEELSSEKREKIADEFRNMGWKDKPRAMVARILRQTWPDAPNDIFRQAAKMVAEDPLLKRPWYFMEPDCTPMVNGWADMLAEQYNLDLSRPFLGCIEDTYEKINATGQLVKIGRHMVGPGLYPASLSQFTQAHEYCAAAFDLAISRDIIPHARHTGLIQHNWSTGNYRKDESGKIVCDAMPLRFQQHGQPKTMTVNPEAVVVHGCKDSSLLRILLDSAQN